LTARQRFGVLIAAIAAAGALSQPAGAHALLERSSPGNGDRLANPPQELRLWFSEDVSARFRVVRVLDRNGESVGRVALSGSGRLVVARLPELGKGIYNVYWRVLSEDDGHATGGSLVYGVGEAPLGAGAADDGAALSWAEVVLRWFDFALLAALVGSLVMAWVVLPRAAGARADLLHAAGDRVLRLGALCALLAVVSGIFRLGYQLLLLAEQGSGSRLDAGLDLLFATRWGGLWLVREAALVVAAALLSRRARPAVTRRMGRWWQVATSSAVVVAGAAHALTSHASALEPSSALAVIADALHVLSAGAWLGGVAALAVAVWPAGSLDREDSRALGRACRTPFAECMAVSVGMVVATGLYSAGRQVASVDGLLTTSYGHVLLVKIGIVLAAGTLGAANFVLLRTLARGTGRFARLAASPPVLLAEALAGVGIFLAAAVLASSVPARGAQFAAPLPARVVTKSVHSADLVFTISSTPTRAGANTFTVVAASSRRPPPAPIEGITLEVQRQRIGGSIPLTQIEPGRYLGSAVLPKAGSWSIVLVARRGGQPLTVPLVWPLGAPDPARPVRYSARALAPPLDAVALLVFSLTLFGVAWILAGRPRLRVAHGPRPAAKGIGGDGR
jgi:copper transport protein